MINHRGPEFKELLGRLQTGMKPYFGTTGDIAILTCAGTGGLEAAIVNTLSPGDRVLAVSIGAFGDRFAKIAEAYGANVDRVSAEWGWAAEPGRSRAGGCHGDVKGRAADPQRDIDRRHEPDPGARGRDSRGGAGRADPRRHRVVAGRRAVRDGRVGHRRRRDRFAEGVDGGAGLAMVAVGRAAGPRWKRRRCRASTSTCGGTATRWSMARRRGRPRSRSRSRSTRGCA